LVRDKGSSAKETPLSNQRPVQGENAAEKMKGTSERKPYEVTSPIEKGLNFSFLQAEWEERRWGTRPTLRVTMVSLWRKN